MRKKNNNQLSIFDIEFPQVPVELPAVIPAEIEETKLKVEDMQNLCPYKIPTIEEIMKHIKSAVYRVDTHQLISDVFECGAISISNMVDLVSKAEREERYLQIMNKYQKDEQKLLTEIFGMIYALLSSVVYDNGRFYDNLGELFMRCNQGNKSVGQFFTPYHISELMARAVIGDEILEKAKNDEILTLNDSCCGGGGMMMAALDVLKNKYNINYARNCFILCSDIDIRCVHMTYLQLSLAGVPAIVRHQNSLTQETWSEWRTPAFIFQYLRFSKYENLGLRRQKSA